MMGIMSQEIANGQLQQSRIEIIVLPGWLHSIAKLYAL
jgi:hypothetical protein